jgi:hypothetical protein
MSADELPVPDQHAAEVLRPRLVRRHAEDHAADPARPQLLRLGGEAKEGIDFPFDKPLHGKQPGRGNSGPLHPFDLRVRVEPDACRHDRHVSLLARAHDIDADSLALQLGDGADGFMREQLEAAGMYACERGDRHAGIQASDLRCCVSKREI